MLEVRILAAGASAATLEVRILAAGAAAATLEVRILAAGASAATLEDRILAGGAAAATLEQSGFFGVPSLTEDSKIRRILSRPAGFPCGTRQLSTYRKSLF